MRPTSTRPLIAVNGCLECEGGPKLTLRTRYADAVLRAGGIPVAVPPVGGPADLERLVGRVDGLLLSGGDDFRTERLGLGPTHPAAVPVPAEKQDFDVELARAALAAELPVLGICYGMQLLGLLNGATLLQHLPEDRPGARPHDGGARHAVQIARDTKLARVMEVERCEVVSRHHQALAAVPSPWLVSATDDQGLVEAIERPDQPFALGVQWHPELSAEGSADDRLFRALVGAASLRAGRQRRTSPSPGPRPPAARQASPGSAILQTRGSDA